jgi:hypothetical protein
MTPRSRPSLHFHYPAPLRTRLERLLSAVEHGEEPTRHAEALAGVVTELADAGLEFFFMKPMHEAKMNFVLRQSAGFGKAGVLRVLSPMVRTILGGANDAQLRVICRHIRGLMVEEHPARQ